MSIILGIPFAKENFLFNNTNLGLSQLAAVLKENGHTVKLADFSDFTEEEFISTLTKEKPAVIGFRCLTPERMEVVKMIRITRRILPLAKIILGGPHPSIMYEQMLNHYSEIDFIVIGEGEITTLELIKKIYSGEADYSDIKGLAYMKDGKLIVTPGRDYIKNLDDLPIPSLEYDIRKNEKPISKIFLNSCRGCPMNCNFCTSNSVWGKNYRSLTIPEIIKRIKYYMEKYKIDRIHFCDDTINSTRKRIIDLCKAIVDNNLNIKWSSAARVNILDDEIMYWMKKSGCIRIEFGVESGSAKLRNKMNKHITNNQIKHAFMLSKKYNIEALAFIMWGYPGENLFTIFQTVSLIWKIRPESICTSICGYFPGTALTEEAKAQGKFHDKKWLILRRTGLVPFNSFIVGFLFIFNYLFGKMYSITISRIQTQVSWDRRELFEG